MKKLLLIVSIFFLLIGTYSSNNVYSYSKSRQTDYKKILSIKNKILTKENNQYYKNLLYRVNKILKRKEHNLYYNLEGKIPTIYINKQNEFYYNGRLTYLVKDNSKKKKYNICYKTDCNLESNIGFEQKVSHDHLAKEIPFHRTIEYSKDKKFLIKNNYYVYYSDNNDIFLHINKFSKDYYTSLKDLVVNKDEALSRLRYLPSNNKIYLAEQQKMFSVNSIRNIDTKGLTIQGIEQSFTTPLNTSDFGGYTSNNIKILKEIIKKTEQITYGKKTEQEKIKAIYLHIRENYEYDDIAAEQIDKYGQVKKGRVVSQNAFGTFINKKGICSGKSSLFNLMLSIAGVKDIEYVSGYNYDRDTGKFSGHSWTRIGKYYYDVTFGHSYKGNKYLYYYKVPKEVLLQNRLLSGQETIKEYLEKSKKRSYDYFYQKTKLLLKNKNLYHILLYPDITFAKNGIHKNMSIKEIYTKLNSKLYFVYYNRNGFKIAKNGKEIPYKNITGFHIKDTEELYGIYLQEYKKIPQKITLVKNKNKYYLLTEKSY